MFLCPICKQELVKHEKSLKCPLNHSFDYAKSGYVNLLNPGKKNNSKAGDSKEMIDARSTFFKSDAYEPISNMLSQIISNIDNTIIVDAGCGEGYYTKKLAKLNTGSIVFGFDMSKFGCEHGAKEAKRDGITNLNYAVSNIFDLPLPSESVDVVTSLFAPVAHNENFRILKSGGYMIVISAGVEHLNGLKAVLYDIPYSNEEKILNFENFELIDVKNLKYEVQLHGNSTITSLFTMTPYYHRTSLKDKEKLYSIEQLNTTIEVNYAIYKKQKAPLF